MGETHKSCQYQYLRSELRACKSRTLRLWPSCFLGVRALDYGAPRFVNTTFLRSLEGVKWILSYFASPLALQTPCIFQTWGTLCKRALRTAQKNSRILKFVVIGVRMNFCGWFRDRIFVDYYLNSNTGSYHVRLALPKNYLSNNFVNNYRFGFFKNTF